MRSRIRPDIVSMISSIALHGLLHADLAVREVGQLAGRGHRGRPSLGGAAQGGDALRHSVGAQPRHVDDLVELQVDAAEVGPDDVPVGLLADEREVDELGQRGLQVATTTVSPWCVHECPPRCVIRVAVGGCANPTPLAGVATTASRRSPEIRARDDSASAVEGGPAVVVVAEEHVGVEPVGQEGRQPVRPAGDVGLRVGRAAQPQVQEAADAAQVGLVRSS